MEPEDDEPTYSMTEKGWQAVDELERMLDSGLSLFEASVTLRMTPRFAQILLAMAAAHRHQLEEEIRASE